MARGLALKETNTSHKLVELKVENEHNKKYVRELNIECDLASIQTSNDRDQIGVVKQKAEKAKIELMHAKKGFEDQLVKA